MKKIFVIFIVFLNIMPIHSQICDWTVQISGKYDEYISDYVLDNLGNMFVLGKFKSDTIFFNNNKLLLNSKFDINQPVINNIFLAKFDKDGNCQWAERIEGGWLLEPFGIAIDSEKNIYITGTNDEDTIKFNNNISLPFDKSAVDDIFISKYDKDGICQWAERISGWQNEIITGMEFNSKDEIIITGIFSSVSVQFNNGYSLNNSFIKALTFDAFFAKYDRNGNCIGAELISGNNNDWISLDKIDNEDNLIISGYFDSDTIKFNNDKFLTSKYFGDIVKDYFTVKFNNMGACLSAETIENEFKQENDNDDNLYLFGNFEGDSIEIKNSTKLFNSSINKFSTDAFIVKFGAEGEYLWSKKISGNFNESINSLTFDDANNFYIIGDFNSDIIYFNNGISLKYSREQRNNDYWDSDNYIAKFDSNGTCQWAILISNCPNCIDKIIFDVQNNIYLKGKFLTDKIIIDGKVILSNSISNDGTFKKYQDSFILKILPASTSVLNNFLIEKFSISPNPASDYISISIPDNLYSNHTLKGMVENGLEKVQIFNILGIEMSSAGGGRSEVDGGGYRINVSNLPFGIYFIKIGDRVEKFVKM